MDCWGPVIFDSVKKFGTTNLTILNITPRIDPNLHFVMKFSINFYLVLCINFQVGVGGNFVQNFVSSEMFVQVSNY